MTIVDTIADAHYGDRVGAGDGVRRTAERGGARAGGGRRRCDPVRRAGVQRLHGRGERLGHRGAGARGRGPRAARPRCTSATATASRRTSTGRATLGAEWRQYEAIFPALAASRIDQVSLECRNSHVPMELLGLLAGKDVLVGVIDVATDAWRRPRRSPRRSRRRWLRAGGAAVPLHQLRHGADAPGRGGGEAGGARRRRGAGAAAARSVALRRQTTRRTMILTANSEVVRQTAAQDRQRLAHHLHRPKPQHAEGRARRRPRPARCIRWRSWSRRSRMRWRSRISIRPISIRWWCRAAAGWARTTWARWRCTTPTRGRLMGRSSPRTRGSLGSPCATRGIPARATCRPRASSCARRARRTSSTARRRRRRCRLRQPSELARTDRLSCLDGHRADAGRHGDMAVSPAAGRKRQRTRSARGRRTVLDRAVRVRLGGRCGVVAAEFLCFRRAPRRGADGDGG